MKKDSIIHPSLSLSLSLSLSPSLVICLRLNGGQVNKVSKMGFSFILEWLSGGDIRSVTALKKVDTVPFGCKVQGLCPKKIDLTSGHTIVVK